MKACARWLVGVSLLFVAACTTSPTSSDAALEQWRYVGIQRIPTLVRVEGALVLTRISADRFEGALDVQRIDALGEVERLRGLVSGRRSDNTMDFEAAIDGAMVRHVGRVSGDSVSGTWLDDSNPGALLLSGTFVLVREP